MLGRMFIRRSFAQLVLVFLTLSLIVACSSNKPSNADLKRIVKEQLGHRISGYRIGFKEESLDIHSIEIKEWGNFNKTQKYWPIKIRVTGEYGMFGVEIDNTLDCKVFKDDYGKWKIK